MQVCLPFGENDCFELELADAAVIGVYTGGRSQPLSDPAGALTRALAQPLDFPPLCRALVPGDRVVLAVDGTVPQLSRMVERIVLVLLSANVEPADVTLLVSERPRRLFQDPRSALPPGVREAIAICRHDPAQEDRLGYLATTAGGQRIYLNRCLVEADFVVPVARVGFDPLLGYRSATGALFPGFSDEPTIKRLQRRLPTPAVRADAEVIRRETEEVSWLLGLQFAVEVLDGGGDRVIDVCAGALDSLAQRVPRVVDKQWQINVDAQAETVVASINGGASGASFADFGSALEAAAAAVKPGGRVLLLAQVSGPLQAGMQWFVEAEEPNEVFPLLHRHRPDDCVAAYQLAAAVKKAKVYWLSGLDGNQVEDLFMVPVESAAEAQRVVKDAETCLFLGNAHRMCVAANDRNESHG